MRNTRIQRAVHLPQEPGAGNAAFYLFCVFLVSYFLHLTARMQVLGTMHFDLMLAAATVLPISLGGRRSTPGWSAGMDPVAKRLWILVGYILVTIPFVEWPGSVLHNLEPYAKSLCFFFFVVATVDTTRKLRVLLTVYVATQLWRGLEPLFIPVTFRHSGAAPPLGDSGSTDRRARSAPCIIHPHGVRVAVLMTPPPLPLFL